MRLRQRFVNDADDAFPFSHGSQIVLADKRQLACVWFSGSLEGHADVVVRLSRLFADRTHSPFIGPEWTDPVTVAAKHKQALGNPVLFVESPDLWHLFYVTFPPRTARETRVLMQSSKDQGTSWTEPREISSTLGYWPRHPLVRVPDAWLLPVCNACTRPPHSMIWRSTDHGANWMEIAVPKTSYLIQPMLIDGGGGQLQLYLRDMRCRNIYRAVSVDGGRNWIAPEPLPLPNNNSGLFVLHLASGKLLLAFNDEQRRDRRSPITLALSDDRGRSWARSKVLIPFQDIDAARLQYSYPSIVQTPDGVIHLTLTYKAERIAHYSFDDAWLTTKGRLAAVRPDLVSAPRCAIRRLHLGETVYLADKATMLDSAPSELIGLLGLLPLNSPALRDEDAKESELILELTRPARLIIAYDASARDLPQWLQAYTAYPGKMRTSEGEFQLLQTQLDKGVHRLGPNAAAPAGSGNRMFFGFLSEDPGDLA